MALQNTGRAIVYTNQVPYETDILRTNMYKMADISQLSQTILGTGLNNGTLVAGCSVSPTGPASLSVSISAGSIYQLEDYDATDYGVIPANHTQIYKQGINLSSVQISLPAPGSAGTNYYLIQAKLLTSDVNVVNRPYYNSADPSDPIFNSQSDTRVDTVFLSSKVSTVSFPSPDAGFVALANVTVVFGQTTITSGDIAIASGAPYITESLTQKISQSTADMRYVTKADEQSGLYVYSEATGTNSIVANFTPAISPLSAGCLLRIKIQNNNTSSVTLTVNSNSAKDVVKHSVSGNVALSGNELISDLIYLFLYNGTQFELLNPTISGGTPIGTIIDFGGTVLQTDHLPCNGGPISRTTYAALFSQIGITWGDGDGSTTFNLPDLSRRTKIGVGGTGTAIIDNTTGSIGGEETHSLTALENGPHQHSITGVISNYCDGGSNSTYNTTGGVVSAGTTFSGNGDPHNIMQPSAVVYMQIKYR